MTTEQEHRAAALMDRAQHGDATAYTELLTMLAAIARVYVRRRIGDSPMVDDVSQETLLSVHGARRLYDPRRPFAPWFMAILNSRLIDSLRREQRITRRESPAASAPEIAWSAEPVLEAYGFDVMRIRAAIQALPPRQRHIIHALKFRDESVREVAAKLGMSESAVKVAAHRAYRALRLLLGARR